MDALFNFFGCCTKCNEASTEKNCEGQMYSKKKSDNKFQASEDMSPNLLIQPDKKYKKHGSNQPILASSEKLIDQNGVPSLSGSSEKRVISSSNVVEISIKSKNEILSNQANVSKDKSDTNKMKLSSNIIQGKPDNQSEFQLIGSKSHDHGLRAQDLSSGLQYEIESLSNKESAASKVILHQNPKTSRTDDHKNQPMYAQESKEQNYTSVMGHKNENDFSDILLNKSQISSCVEELKTLKVAKTICKNNILRGTTKFNSKNKLKRLTEMRPPRLKTETNFNRSLSNGGKTSKYTPLTSANSNKHFFPIKMIKYKEEVREYLVSESTENRNGEIKINKIRRLYKGDE